VWSNCRADFSVWKGCHISSTSSNAFPGAHHTRSSHVTLIADGPPYRASAGLFELALHEKLFLKLTTNNVRRAHDGLSTPESFFGELVRRFGSSRIAWGSNFPNEAGTLKQQVQEVKAALAFLPSADQENILCGRQ